MGQATLTKQSLVIYKNTPAIVESTGDKIEIKLQNGSTKSVRPKDVEFLHKGPIQALSQLTELKGDIEGAHELLEGETIGINELAELVFGEDTPNACWNCWLILQQNQYFTGSIDAIQPRSKEEIEKAAAEEDAKLAAQAEWEAYLERVKSGSVTEDDNKFLQDIERLATGAVSANKTLKELSMPQTPEKAHELLLKLNYWPETQNPYPVRSNLATTCPNHLAVTEVPEEERLDLTHLQTFAIDDEGSTDPDDAISLDGDSIWVHVADAACLIAPNSDLDLEARSRGANLYLPELVSTMLPEKVTHLLGLGLADTSPALSIKLKLDSDGNAILEELTPSVVKVTRTSYKEADAQMDQQPFSGLAAITEQFRAKRFANNAANLDLPEVKINVIDEEIIIKPLPVLASRNMVTDGMLMAGEAVAKFAMENNITIPYATQISPESLETPQTMADMFAYRKQFKRTELHLAPSKHFSLGLDHYTRFTSPLRRYTDLLVHQQLRAFIAKRPLISEDDLLQRLSESELSAIANSTVERLSNRHWTLLYLKRHPDWSSSGIVVDKRDKRGTVIIPELGLDVKMGNLEKYNLNDEVELAVAGMNLPELDLFVRKI